MQILNMYELSQFNSLSLIWWFQGFRTNVQFIVNPDANIKLGEPFSTCHFHIT